VTFGGSETVGVAVVEAGLAGGSGVGFGGGGSSFLGCTAFSSTGGGSAVFGSDFCLGFIAAQPKTKQKAIHRANAFRNISMALDSRVFCIPDLFYETSPLLIANLIPNLNFPNSLFLKLIFTGT
jgi:hypothetical protein